MACQKYKTVCRAGRWEVRFGGRRDPDLTKALRQAIGEKCPSTQRKAALFVRRYLNFRVRAGETHDALISEDVVLGRIRIEAWLQSIGYVVVYETDRIDGSCYVRREGGGSISSISVGLAAIARLYLALARAGLRPKSNPMKVDGWHRMGAGEKLELGQAVMGPKADYRRYRGSQYIASGLTPCPIRMEDAAGLGPRMLAAGRAFNWPPEIFDLVTVMADDGPRWSNASPLTAGDWGRASGFGRALRAPNKGSKGVRVREITIRVETVQQLRNSFDTDPTRPSMAELERLLAERRFDLLDRIFLFPSKRGIPHSYHVFNNDYVRPAMEAAGLQIVSVERSVRPTGHRLRAARIQAEIDLIYDSGASQDEIDAQVAQVQDDVGIKSGEAFERYVGPKKAEHSIRLRIARKDARDRQSKVQAAALTNAPAASRPASLPSRAEARLAAYR